MEQVAFGIIAAITFGSGLMVVIGKRLVHCVLWLAVTLMGTAALYVLLSAPFLAGVQVILYTGGIITLMLFGVMLTRRASTDLAIQNEQNRHVAGVTIASVVFAVVAVATYRTTEFPARAEMTGDTSDIGRMFLTEHLMAFEVLSLLLLAAMIGAIVIARRRDHQPPEAASAPAEKSQAAAEAEADENDADDDAEASEEEAA